MCRFFYSYSLSIIFCIGFIGYQKYDVVKGVKDLKRFSFCRGDDTHAHVKENS
jgi:hypothetical protein